jgi:hypothetical protein
MGNSTACRVACQIIFYCFFCVIAGFLPGAYAQAETASDAAAQRTLLIGVGDSLTHGTMDATINATGTLNAYLQKIADSLGRVTAVDFVQPFFDNNEHRLMFFKVPTNLGVDGADIFSAEGIEYYKRAGVSRSFINPDYLCRRLLPHYLQSTCDKVLYPINLLSHRPVSQIDAAVWLLDQQQPSAARDRVILMYWLGNNDTSTAALGYGAAHPEFWPIPLEQIAAEIKPELSTLLHIAEDLGIISLAPYTLENINRNMTGLQDFVSQYEHLLARLHAEAIRDSESIDVFLLTLPYYCSTGYLFDSDDLEFYLKKINAAYTVPSTFKRVAEPGQPVIEPLKGDRVSLLTFSFMYLLLNSGYSVDYVNQILETDGKQRDGLVLAEEEQRVIMRRIDGFNAAIKDAAAHDPRVHLIDIGQYLNDVLTNKTTITINRKKFTRKWCRGGGFSMDGVHPGYTGHALIANFILEQLNDTLGFAAPLYDLPGIMQQDPYIDRDGDGWVSGPAYTAPGFTELLFMFKDPDDSNAAVQPDLPVDVWQRISDFFMQKII